MREKILIMSYLSDSTNKINDIFVSFFAFIKRVDAVLFNIRLYPSFFCFNGKKGLSVHEISSKPAWMSIETCYVIIVIIFSSP